MITRYVKSEMDVSGFERILNWWTVSNVNYSLRKVTYVFTDPDGMEYKFHKEFEDGKYMVHGEESISVNCRLLTEDREIADNG